jgi:hypothetical protein
MSFISAAKEYDQTENLNPPYATMAKDCKLTMSIPAALKQPQDWPGSGIRCGKAFDTDRSNTMVIGYYVNGFASPSTWRRVELGIYYKDINSTLNDQTISNIYRDENGELDTGFDAPSICRTTDPRTIVTPLSGSNWHGWVVEEAFDQPNHKITNEDCLKFTPDYRCVSLLIGNDQMSLTLSGYCFLRKHEDSLQTELSYDIFMDMIKTIRFKSGTAEAVNTH